MLGAPSGYERVVPNGQARSHMASWAAECDHNGSGKRESTREVRVIGAGRNRVVGEVDERGPRNPKGKDALLVMQPHVKVGIRSEGVGGD